MLLCDCGIEAAMVTSLITHVLTRKHFFKIYQQFTSELLSDTKEMFLVTGRVCESRTNNFMEITKIIILL